MPGHGGSPARSHAGLATAKPILIRLDYDLSLVFVLFEHSIQMLRELNSSSRISVPRQHDHNSLHQRRICPTDLSEPCDWSLENVRVIESRELPDMITVEYGQHLRPELLAGFADGRLRDRCDVVFEIFDHAVRSVLFGASVHAAVVPAKVSAAVAIAATAFAVDLSALVTDHFHMSGVV